MGFKTRTVGFHSLPCNHPTAWLGSSAEVSLTRHLSPHIPRRSHRCCESRHPYHQTQSAVLSPLTLAQASQRRGYMVSTPWTPEIWWGVWGAGRARTSIESGRISSTTASHSKWKDTELCTQRTKRKLHVGRQPTSTIFTVTSSAHPARQCDLQPLIFTGDGPSPRPLKASKNYSKYSNNWKKQLHTYHVKWVTQASENNHVVFGWDCQLSEKIGYLTLIKSTN